MAVAAAWLLMFEFGRTLLVYASLPRFDPRSHPPAVADVSSWRRFGAGRPAAYVRSRHDHGRRDYFLSWEGPHAVSDYTYGFSLLLVDLLVICCGVAGIAAVTNEGG